MRTVYDVRIEYTRNAELPWCCRVMQSNDGGETWELTGEEAFFTSSQEKECSEFFLAHRSPLPVHPVITDTVQRRFESEYTGYDHVPKLCGYFGRACRCMGDHANRALCNGCPLRAFAIKEARKAFARS